MEEIVKKLQQWFDAPEDKLSYEIIGAAIEVHRTLGGPGLMESVYEEAMVYELQRRGLTVALFLCPFAPFASLRQIF
jgi:hypothetical protein